MDRTHIVKIYNEDQKVLRAKRNARKKIKEANRRATKLEEKACKLRKRAAVYALSVQNQEKKVLKRNAKQDVTVVERKLKKLGL